MFGSTFGKRLNVVLLVTVRAPWFRVRVCKRYACVCVNRLLKIVDLSVKETQLPFNVKQLE